MKVQYCSDLHFNNPDNISFFANGYLDKSAEILILGGDVTFLNYFDRPFEKSFFRRLSDNYERVIYLLGNSEFYGGEDTAILDRPFLERLHENLIVVNNYTESIGFHRFIFSTLWSEVSVVNEREVINGSHDFHYFRYKGASIDRQIYNRWHSDAVAYIRKALSDNPLGNKQVVVTHHMPSMKCSTERWEGSPLNDVFVAHQDALVEFSEAAFWLYGHSHENRSAFSIGKTTLLTNQLAENISDCSIKFDRGKVFEL